MPALKRNNPLAIAASIGLMVLFIISLHSVILADWARQDTHSFAWYKDITFVTKDRGWIVGTEGVILSTDNGGETWQPRARFTTDNFLQIHFTDEYTGWILCERNIYARGNNPISYLRKTTDGGRNWEKIEFENIGRERVTRLLFGPDGRATAFGEGGIFYKLQEDGVTWKKYQTAIHFLLMDGAYGENSLGAIVGAGGTIMFTEDGGLTWEKATLMGDYEARFNAVFFEGKAGGWAVGTAGHIFHSVGGGRLWRPQNSTVTADLNDVYFTSVQNGWAVGDNGIIVRTRDGGNTWYDEKPVVSHKIERIAFNGDTGFAIGMGGTLLKYTGSANDPGTKPTMMRRN
ncbi:MAG: hypothetical protein JO053_01925 [Acidobacteria bacterium]|nr:hypothetical protein [Acidobacteriota bacterium]